MLRTAKRLDGRNLRGENRLEKHPQKREPAGKDGAGDRDPPVSQPLSRSTVPRLFRRSQQRLRPFGTLPEEIDDGTAQVSFVSLMKRIRFHIVEFSS